MTARGRDAWQDEDGVVHEDDQQAPRPSRLAVTRLSNVRPERVSWLWPGRIPAGKIVTLDGDPSLGKSTLALSFAAVVTTGGTWPDGSRCEHPGAVVLLAAEDGLADTVRPRADAAGADVSRMHAVEGVTFTDTAKDGTVTTHLRPPTLADVDQLEELVRATGARLLIVDVLMSYLPTGVDSHKDQDVRRVLSRLAALADGTGCTVLLLRHLNKAAGKDPMYRGGGSIGIVGAARAGMLVARDPDDDEVRVLATTKSNLGREPDALTYRLVDAGANGVARVEWIGTSAHDARALLAERDGDQDDDRHAVEDWLRDLLESSGGSLPANDVFKVAKATGFSPDQAKRAKKKLGVRAVKGPTSWGWQLPEPSTPTGDTTSRPLAPLPSSQVRGRRDGVHERKGASEQGSESPGKTCPDCSTPIKESMARCVQCVNAHRVEPAVFGTWSASGEQVLA